MKEKPLQQLKIGIGLKQSNFLFEEVKVVGREKGI
jgi:hypothetical protein